MEIHVVPDARALAVDAAARVAEIISATPNALLLAATGETPMGCYAELGRLARDGSLDASRLRVAQLDEYLGLSQGDPRSLYGWMERALLEPLGIGAERVIRFGTEGVDGERIGREYDAEIETAGGIDLAILGLGPNGHLGFNEPPSDDGAPTRVVSLDSATLESNAGYWQDAVPPRAVTAGMSVILAARRVLLLVSGKRKGSILDRMLQSEPNATLPASFLRQHPRATVIADRDARPDGSSHA